MAVSGENLVLSLVTERQKGQKKCVGERQAWETRPEDSRSQFSRAVPTA